MPSAIEVRKVPIHSVADASELAKLIDDGVLHADRVVAKEAARPGIVVGNKISEAGRAFLAGLLMQLSDDQISALFEVSRVTLRLRDPAKAIGMAEAFVDRVLARIG